jgi:hypothetical protein
MLKIGPVHRVNSHSISSKRQSVYSFNPVYHIMLPYVLEDEPDGLQVDPRVCKMQTKHLPSVNCFFSFETRVLYSESCSLLSMLLSLTRRRLPRFNWASVS